MHFLYSILAFGFFLAAVPVLIHLINLMRHRRVQWAAMEFLLQSYRKHRKWVMLRQLILLLAARDGRDPAGGPIGSTRDPVAAQRHV